MGYDGAVNTASAVDIVGKAALATAGGFFLLDRGAIFKTRISSCYQEQIKSWSL
jgi:hypothetical protein